MHQQFKKLTRLWTGPRKIVLFKSPVVVKLHQVFNGAIQVVHVDLLLPCISLPAIGVETDDEPDTNNQPDTPDQAQVPDEVIQDVPGLFEESTRLGCKNIRPWIRRNPILSFWTLRTRVLRLPGDPLGFESFQRLWSHISLAETLRPNT